MFHVDGRPVVEKELIDVSEDYLSDNFQNGAIDPAVWGQAVSAGSAITCVSNFNGSHGVQLHIPAAGGSWARLYGLDDWGRRSELIPPTSGYGNRSSMFYTVMEFECLIPNHTHIDETTFFMGFATNGLLDDRTSNNITGFIYDADPVQHFSSVTDNGGAETVKDFPNSGTINPAEPHHFRIWCFSGYIIFMIDHVYSQVHNTLNTLNSNFVYPLFYFENSDNTQMDLILTNVSIGYRRYGEQNLR